MTEEADRLLAMQLAEEEERLAQPRATRGIRRTVVESDYDDDDEEEEEEEAPRRRASKPAATRGKAVKKKKQKQQKNKPGRRRMTSDEASDDEESASEGQDDEEDEDERLARELDAEMNGGRARARRPPTSTYVVEDPRKTRRQLRPKRRHHDDDDEEDASDKDDDSDDSGWRRRGGRGGGRQAKRRSGRAKGNVSYREQSDHEDFDDNNDDEEEEGGGKGTRRRRTATAAPVEDARPRRLIPALLDAEDVLDDEVEAVLAHRFNADTSSLSSADRWATAQFHIKWASYSHLHTSWESMATLSQLAGFKRVVNYTRAVDADNMTRLYASREEIENLDVEHEMKMQMVQDFMSVERVVSERNEGAEWLIKWQGLPYSECTWETDEAVRGAREGEAALEAYRARAARLAEGSARVKEAREAAARAGVEQLTEQPAFLQFGTLREYQLQGLQFLVHAWASGRSSILADEMGLGKTIQAAAFTSYLSEVHRIRGPFLVIVPLSTVANWIREYRRWVPQVNAIVYVGDQGSREVLQQFEFVPGAPRVNRPVRFEVLITTYELALKDAGALSSISWAGLVVDEAHRLKNADSQLYRTLSSWSFAHRLLLTGTPLQNNLHELHSLLHFLEPRRFSDRDDFIARYSLDDPESLAQLHADLRPYLIRRVIRDVEKSLPPKSERILRVEMSPLQRMYYKLILTKNFDELNKNVKSSGSVSLLNVLMELRKCACHPFLFESAEEQYSRGATNEDTKMRLVTTSSKMLLLDKLLTRLKERKDRVLIFSQMVRVLDIIQDYLQLSGYTFERIDGSTPGASRQAAMDRFNAPSSNVFCFLLTTRAGGLGINLATANTVIIFDSDFVPAADKQAIARVYRIGQKEAVSIYRFVTRGTVEEDILERAKRKMVLDHLVIEQMDTSGRTVLNSGTDAATKMFDKSEFAKIVKFGAEDLFRDDAEQKGAEAMRHMAEANIDDILAQAETVETTDKDVGRSDLLNSYRVATIKTEEDDATFWERLIKEADRPKALVVEEPGVRQARLKQLEGPKVQGGGGGGDGGARKTTPVGSRRDANKNRPGPPLDGALLRIDQCIDPTLPSEPFSLSKRDALAFVKAVRRYGTIGRMTAIVAEVGDAVSTLSDAARVALWQCLVNGTTEVLRLAALHPELAAAKATVKASGRKRGGGKATGEAEGGGDGDKDKDKDQVAPGSGDEGDKGGSPTPVAGAALAPAPAKKARAPRTHEPMLDFFGTPVKASDLLQRLHEMKTLADQMRLLRDPSEFLLDSSVHIFAAPWTKTIGWTNKHDAMLLAGMHMHGVGAWETIAKEDKLGLRDLMVHCLGGGDGEGGGGEGGKEEEEKQGKVVPAVDGTPKPEEDAAGGLPAVAAKPTAKDFPKPAQIETRALQLLRRLAPYKPPFSTAPPPAAKSSKAARAAVAPVDTAKAMQDEPKTSPTPPASKSRTTAGAIRVRSQLAAAREAAASGAVVAPVTAAPPPPPPSTDAGKRKGAAVKRVAKKARVTTDPPTGPPAPDIDQAAPPSPDDVPGCLASHRNEVLDLCRELRLVQTGDLTREAKLAQFKRFILALGERIESADEADRAACWSFVERMSQSSMSAENLASFYKRIKEAKAAGEGAMDDK